MYNLILFRFIEIYILIKRKFSNHPLRNTYSLKIIVLIYANKNEIATRMYCAIYRAYLTDDLVDYFEL